MASRPGPPRTLLTGLGLALLLAVAEGQVSLLEPAPAAASSMEALSQALGGSAPAPVAAQPPLPLPPAVPLPQGSLAPAPPVPPTQTQVLQGDLSCTVFRQLQQLPNTSVSLQAFSAAGLASVLDDPSFKGTVFVPLDAAWAILLKVLSKTQAQLFADQGVLQSVMSYHIVPGRAYAWQQLWQLPYLQPLPTMANQPLLFYSKPGEVNVAATSRQVAPVVNLDVPGCGRTGMGHLVAAVLSPDPKWNGNTGELASLLSAAEATTPPGGEIQKFEGGGK